MANDAMRRKSRSGSMWRIMGWGVAGLFLLLPLVLNAPWTSYDFILAGLLIGGVGGVLELTARFSRSPSYLATVAFALAAAILTFSANGMVGMIGSEGNPLNLMFGGVIAVALVGAVLARFRAEGMARAMALAAVAQLAAGGFGALTDLRGGILASTFALLWLFSAMLFGKAARGARTA